jgi:hypothetical protein
MSEKRKKKAPEKIHSILERVLSGLNIGIKAKQFEIWEVWDSVVGQHIARHAQPQQIRNMVLWTVVSSSPWMQQLGFMKKTIVDRLNERIGEEVVKDIKFRMGEFPPPDSMNDKKDNTSSSSPHQ